MRKLLIGVLVACCLPFGCKKPASSAPSAVTAASPNDQVTKSMAAIAGAGATNCGRLQTQASADLSAASKCAMDAAQQKHPFYVAYDMPGMTVGVAGNSEGKLFTLQSQTGGAGLMSTECPAQLRVAPSGRVTCYAPGTFPMGAGMGSHGGMSSAPAGMPNPHKASGAQAQPNPSH